MKVFRINDCDWYMADSLDEAISLAVADYELPQDEVVDRPREVSAEAMKELMYVKRDWSKWSFAEELQHRIQTGAKSGMFASTEF